MNSKKLTNLDPKVKGIPFHSPIFSGWHHLTIIHPNFIQIIRVLTVGYYSDVVGRYNKNFDGISISNRFRCFFWEAWCTGKLSIPTRQASLPKMLAQCCALPRPEVKATVMWQNMQRLAVFSQVLGVFLEINDWIYADTYYTSRYYILRKKTWNYTIDIHIYKYIRIYTIYIHIWEGSVFVEV